MAWRLFFKSLFVKCDPETPNRFTALHTAATAPDFIWDKTSFVIKRLETVTKLLRNPETNVNERNGCGETPLHLACKTDFKEVVVKLIMMPDIDVNARDNSGKTPVMVAVEYGKKEALRLMLRDQRVKWQCGLEDMLHDFHGDYGDFLACYEMIMKEDEKRRSINCVHVKAMIKLNSSQRMFVNERDRHGWTKLHYAALAPRSVSFKQRMAVITNILENPFIFVNAQTNKGETALHVACRNNFSEAVSKLLTVQDIDVNVIDISGNTPVMAAAKHGKEKALGLMLMDPRVDLDCRNNLDKGLEEILEDFSIGRDFMERIQCSQMIKKTRMTRRQWNSQQRRGFHAYNIGINTATKYSGGMKDGWSLSYIEMTENMIKTNEEREKRSKEKLDMQIKNVKSDSDKLEAAKKTLECPICLELMKPPTRIWMCQTSHLICEGCKDQLDGLRCPMCRVESVTLQALYAEHLSETLFYKSSALHFQTKRVRTKRGIKEDEGDLMCMVRPKEGIIQLMKNISLVDTATKNDTSDWNFHALEGVQKTLECPVCLKLMKPPTRIWMCRTSHLICEGCKDHLDGLRCPMCRNDRITLPALFAEYVAETLF